MDKQNVVALSYPTIDRLCLKHQPELIYENQLSSLLKELFADKLIQKSEKGGVMFTKKGLDYLEEHSVD